MLTRNAAGALAAAGLLIGSSSAWAVVVYDNGPINGTIDSWDISLSSGEAMSDSFALQSAFTITGIDLGLWTLQGDTVSTVDWGITTMQGDFNFNSGHFVASGTATVFNGSPTPNSPTTSTSVDTFSTGAVNLSAGVYYLVLLNAVATNNDPVGWDVTNGMSSAVQSLIGNLQNWYGPGTTGSESFQVIGTDGDGDDIPEPASWALMLVGFGGVGGAVRAVRAARQMAPS